MPNQETQILDNIIASRRALLVSGGAALAAFALPSTARAYNTVTSFTDNDILNFALNLEYLEANFYYLAAFGTTIDMPQTFSGAMTQGISGVLGSGGNGNTTAGVTATITGTAASNKLAFANPLVAAYAQETAIEEGKHVAFLRSALGSAAVAQPALNLTGGTTGIFNTLATAAGVPAGLLPFSPLGNAGSAATAPDASFLVGAYIFEDVGVSAYHGAAPLITNKATILAAAVGIHAVEAYHAGLVRTTLNALDPTGSLGLVAATTAISAFRNTASQALKSTNTLSGSANPEDPSTDDYGIATQMVTLGSASATTATRIVDADPVMVTGFARSTAQVLNIVTAGASVTAGTPSKGGFYPNGLNGLFV
jgi:hypothetical protein